MPWTEVVIRTFKTVPRPAETETALGFRCGACGKGHLHDGINGRKSPHTEEELAFQVPIRQEILEKKYPILHRREIDF